MPSCYIAYVYRYRRYKNQPVCSCGWIGKRRLLLSVAVVYAYLHCSETDCEPGYPLVVRVG